MVVRKPSRDEFRIICKQGTLRGEYFEEDPSSYSKYQRLITEWLFYIVTPYLCVLKDHWSDFKLPDDKEVVYHLICYTPVDKTLNHVRGQN